MSKPAPGLPIVTVARFEWATGLIERLYEENVDLFVGKMRDYRERSREGSQRPLSAAEATSLASGLATALSDADAVEVAERLQAGSLKAVDEPGAQEVLVAAGVATAPAFLRAALRLVALLEMPAEVFEEAYDAGTVDARIDDAIVELRKLDLEDARKRATAALDHLAEKAGAGSGEGLRLLARTVWQALNQAAQDMAPSFGSGLSSLTDSQPPTDGPGESAFTESPSVTR